MTEDFSQHICLTIIQQAGINFAIQHTQLPPHSGKINCDRHRPRASTGDTSNTYEDSDPPHSDPSLSSGVVRPMWLVWALPAT